jgi:hypothetical protein
MPSSLIDIADWIDRFGMDLLDGDSAFASEGDRPTVPETSEPRATSGPVLRVIRETLVVALERRWAHEPAELLH